jgi:DNA processing protein
MNTSMKDLAAILTASEIAPADLRDISELVETYGIDSLWSEELRGSQHTNLLTYLRSHMDPKRIDFWVGKLERLSVQHRQVRMITVTDIMYPANLKEAYDRPPFIYVDGTVVDTDQQALAIVGSRKAEDSVFKIAYEIAHAAAEASITVVSGLARGVDGTAHRAALDANGRTIAVLGAGIDVKVYPPEHEELARRIAASGALISHFRPGSPYTKSTFVARNAVISGLCGASLLVDAGERSGTRTEAESALKQGRNVLLWAPTMSHFRWARVFAEQTGVQMVDTIDDVLSTASKGTL